MHIVEQVIQTSGIKFRAMDGETEVGRAYLYLLYNDQHEEPAGYVEDVFVEESHRGHGLGTQLLETVLNKARELGCYKLVGTSRMEKEHVHAWYEKYGLKKHGYSFRIDLDQ